MNKTFGGSRLRVGGERASAAPIQNIRTLTNDLGDLFLDLETAKPHPGVRLQIPRAEVIPFVSLVLSQLSVTLLQEADPADRQTLLAQLRMTQKLDELRVETGALFGPADPRKEETEG
jgi:hypothetical protein